MQCIEIVSKTLELFGIGRLGNSNVRRDIKRVMVNGLGTIF